MMLLLSEELVSRRFAKYSILFHRPSSLNSPSAERNMAGETGSHGFLSAQGRARRLKPDGSNRGSDLCLCRPWSQESSRPTPSSSPTWGFRTWTSVWSLWTLSTTQSSGSGNCWGTAMTFKTIPPVIISLEYYLPYWRRDLLTYCIKFNGCTKFAFWSSHLIWMYT